jgi:hypothetical protein
VGAVGKQKIPSQLAVLAAAKTMASRGQVVSTEQIALGWHRLERVEITVAFIAMVGFWQQCVCVFFAVCAGLSRKSAARKNGGGSKSMFGSFGSFHCVLGSFELLKVSKRGVERLSARGAALSFFDFFSSVFSKKPKMRQRAAADPLCTSFLLALVNQLTLFFSLHWKLPTGCFAACWKLSKFGLPQVVRTLRWNIF